MDNELYLGSETGNSENKISINLKYANRHGLIAGATGTGKTVTLQGMAEGFSKEGVPVFLADVKGDLTGMSAPSDMQDFFIERAKTIGFADEYQGYGFPMQYWDIHGEKGTPVRTTVSEMGPMLLSRLLDLNDTQEGVLNICFRLADSEGLLLLDLKDLRSLLVNMSARASELSAEYGNVSTASIGSIQRKLLQLEDEGGDVLFGEPALDLNDFIKTDREGMGVINLLAAEKLIQTPKAYFAFLLWLLSELFENLPEVGDQDKPKFVFFFDEAHLLFADTPKFLVEKIEMIVKLIRSKGVGVYFITQSPDDIPESVLSQLGNRIQHALRAFTPKQKKAIKLAAETYRENPNFKVEDAITEMAVGEALVSTLEKKGQPSIVERVLVRPPYSKLGPLEASVLSAEISKGYYHDKYKDAVDRESAYEILQKRGEEAAIKAEREKGAEQEQKEKKRTSSRQTPTEALVKSVLRSVGSQLGRQLVRGILGALKK